MPSPRALRLAIPALLVSATGCFALFPLDDYQQGAEAIDGGTTAPQDAVADQLVTPANDGGDDEAKRIIFVTSSTQTAKLDGVEGADKVCQQLAAAAGLSGTFKALLSGEQSDVVLAQRFALADEAKAGKGPIVDRQGHLLAQTYAALLQRGPSSPIVVDETGATIGFGPELGDGGGACPSAAGVVWTNFSGNGGTESAVDCTEWTIDDSSNNGRVGFALATNFWRTACNLPCSEKAHLYCGQQ